jgi:hypothetical protein
MQRFGIAYAQELSASDFIEVVRLWDGNAAYGAEADLVAPGAQA